MDDQLVRNCIPLSSSDDEKFSVDHELFLMLHAYSAEVQKAQLLKQQKQLCKAFQLRPILSLDQIVKNVSQDRTNFIDMNFDVWDGNPDELSDLDDERIVRTSSAAAVMQSAFNKAQLRGQQALATLQFAEWACVDWNVADLFSGLHVAYSF